MAELTQEELEALNREELNEVAANAGVEEPESLPNKQAVIDATLESTESESSDADDDEEEDDGAEEEPLTTSDPDSRVEGVAVGDVVADPSTETHASDAADYPFPPGGDVDVGKLDDDELEGETLAPIQPDSGVILGDTDNVPEELQGHPALIINVKNPDPWAEEDEEPVFTVRTRDEHNSTLLLERDDFAEVLPGGVGNRAFGP